MHGLRIVNDLPGVLEDRGLSLFELARLSGLSYAVVRRAATPNANPYIDDVLKIARALCVPANELFRLLAPA